MSVAKHRLVRKLDRPPIAKKAHRSGAKFVATNGEQDAEQDFNELPESGSADDTIVSFPKLKEKQPRSSKPKPTVPLVSNGKQQHAKKEPPLMEIGGFRALLVRLSADSFDDGNRRYIYLKRFVPGAGEFDPEPEGLDPSNSALLLLNLAFDTTEEDVGRLLTGLVGSAVKKTHLLPQNGGTPRRAVVEFEQGTEAVERVLRLSRRQAEDARLLEVAETSTSGSTVGKQRGMAKWLAEYRAERPDPSQLQQEVDRFMFEYDRRKEQERLEQEAEANKPDEEGFVKVMRRGRRLNTDGRVHVTAARPLPSAAAPKPEDRAIANFYRFQRKDSKRQQLEQLQKRFEDDKRRIAQLKAHRKFRPY
jgi:ribosomal RNA-processing protein 7